MGDWLKQLWHDPVWSKVIAALIIVLSGSIGAWARSKWSELWSIKLSKINCYTSFVPNIGYPLKYYVEMRNDSSKCVEVRVLNYLPNKTAGKPLPPEVMQVRFHTKWFPTDLSADKVAVLPGQMCRAWIGMDDKKFTEARVMEATGNIGTLIVSVNKKQISFEL